MWDVHSPPPRSQECPPDGIVKDLKFQGPHSKILMTGGGGGGIRGSYFIPKKSQLQNLSTPKNHYFLSFNIPKKHPLVLFSQPKKSLCFFFATHKNSCIFHRPKKNHFWPKFQTQKNHSKPPPLPSLKYEWGHWV